MIVRLMPHEVADLEPVLKLLAKQSPDDFNVCDRFFFNVINILLS